MSKEETTGPIKVKKTKRNGFAEAHTLLLRNQKMKKPCYYHFVLFFHFNV